jgi:integrase/recombinase XerC
LECHRNQLLRLPESLCCDKIGRHSGACTVSFTTAIIHTMQQIPLHDSIRVYLEHIGNTRSATTLRTYKIPLMGFVKHLGETGIDVDTTRAADISVDWILGYFAAQKSLSPATANVYFWAIYGWLRYLSQEKIADIDLQRFKQAIQKLIPKPVVDSVQTADYYDVSRIVSYAFTLTPKETSGQDERLRTLRDRAVILTLADTGMEVGTLCHLRIGDIDRRRNQLAIVRDGTSTLVHVTPRVLETIFEYLNARKHLDKHSSRSSANLPVFSQHITGQTKQIASLNQRSIHNIVSKRAFEALGAEYDGTISPRSFRHYAVTSVLQSLTVLHSKVTARCRTHFENGYYDDAIFNAMKVIEEEVRERIAGDPTEIGVNLITSAMKKEPTQITFSPILAEQDAHYDLLKGAVGTLKNPHSHRFVGVHDPIRAFESLALASLLMRMLDEAT